MKNLSLLLLPLAIAACTVTGPGAPAQNTPAPASTNTLEASALSANHWRLSEARDAQGKSIDSLMVRADKPLQLDFNDGRVSVSNSCNQINAGYTVHADALEFGRAASTMMACMEPKLAALDGEISNRLQGRVQATLTGAQSLQLVTASGDTLIFNGEPTAETRYGGPGERVFLEVAAQTQPCSHPLIPDMQCLQVREIKYDDKGLKIGTAGAFEHFYSNIEGYQHEPGIRNVLRVNRFKIANPPADAANQAYVLDMVVESENTQP